MGEGTEALRPADGLSSYELLGKLGHGGMAEIFLARQRGPQGFERLVVVKRILRRHANTTSYIRRFVDEAKLVATLDHPHIARIHELGIGDGSCFLVLEYIHGQDLHAIGKRIARLQRRFPIEHALLVGRCVAAALHHAHERRSQDGTPLEIVHRDVSPENVLISYDGVVKLIDFGIAKTAKRSVKTRAGLIKGKLAYLSPEQAKGERLDRRSDVFSLGTVLWELVTGQALFRQDNELATLQSILHTRPYPPSRSRSDCPVELDRILLRALAPDPAVRYQSAEQLELELEELAREQRLRQSPVALRTYMQQLFAAEIVSWNEAQLAGLAGTDQITALLSVEARTPVGEETDDEPEDEDDEEEVTGVDEDDGADEDTIAAEPINETGDYTQVEAFGTIERPEVVTTSVPIAPPVIIGHIDATPPPGSLPLVREPPSSGPFPAAPAEWRPFQTALIPVPPPRKLRTLAIVAVLAGLFVLTIVLAIVIP